MHVDILLFSDDDAGVSTRKDNVSYLALGHFPSHDNRTSSRGSSPADGGRLLLPHPDAPTSTVTLLQKHDRRAPVSKYTERVRSFSNSTDNPKLKFEKVEKKKFGEA